MATSQKEGGRFEEVINLCSEDDESNTCSMPSENQNSSRPSEDLPSTSLSSSSAALNHNIKEENQSEVYFSEFMSLCKNYVKEKEDEKILDNVEKIWAKTETNYKNSRACHTVLQMAISKVSTDKSNLFVHIHELCCELKAQKRRKGSHSASLTTLSNGNTIDETDAEKQQRQIHRLEQILKKLDRRIKYLQQKELSVDDLNDDFSAYIMEDKCKAKLVKTWNLLCKLKRTSRSTGREEQKKFNYKGSRFPDINEAVQDHINKNKEFPDYVTICNIIKDINDKKKLGLSPSYLQVISKETFEQVGEELKRRRCCDNYEMLVYYGFDIQSDPANNDSTLKKTLDESCEIGKKNIDKVLDEFTQQQAIEEDRKRLEPKEEANSDNTDESNSDDDDDDDDSGDNDEQTPSVSNNEDEEDGRETEGISSDSDASNTTKKNEKVKPLNKDSVLQPLNSDVSSQKQFNNPPKHCSKRKTDVSTGDTPTKIQCLPTIIIQPKNKFLSNNNTDSCKKNQVSREGGGSKKDPLIEVITLD